MTSQNWSRLQLTTTSTLFCQDQSSLWWMVSKLFSEKVSCHVTVLSLLISNALLVGIPVFGPSKLAARMEGSKAFSKGFMARHNIPTAQFRVFASNQYDDAVNYVKTCGFQVVLKASGLAAGKGVLIPQTVEDTIRGLDEIMRQKVFADAGSPSLRSPKHSKILTCTT